MTHLTPSIKIAMEKIFEESATQYYFIDKDGSICCGRPLMVAGEIVKAHRLIEKNRKLIVDSGAKTLVTSCPICLKVFKEDYLLENIEVIHHSQFILRLVKEKKIQLNKSELEAVYHDPCELGRGCSVYNEPRELLKKIVNLQTIKNEKGLSMCCGSGMGGINLTSVQRDAIRMDTVTALQKNKPDLIVTACPLCKKTLAISALSEVKDISELAVQSIEKAKKSN
jgi:Fe-S oxidoreductase